MKKLNKIIVILMIIIGLGTTNVEAHGGNITGWKDKNSNKIVQHDGKYYGYHKQNGERHYHEVEWNESKQKWEIAKTAVYYDANFNVIDNASDEKTEKVQVQFVEKVDGDTAKFNSNGEEITVRFLGIDTPETVHPTKGEEPFGKEASNFTEEKLKNATKIELEYDANCSKTDKYERHLAWIWVDDILIQEEIIKSGLARTYMLQDNYKYAGRLQQSEELAKSQKIKIWSNENTEMPIEESVENTGTENGENPALQLKEELLAGVCSLVAFVGIIIKFMTKK